MLDCNSMEHGSFRKRFKAVREEVKNLGEDLKAGAQDLGKDVGKFLKRGGRPQESPRTKKDFFDKLMWTEMLTNKLETSKLGGRVDSRIFEEFSPEIFDGKDYRFIISPLRKGSLIVFAGARDTSSTYAIVVNKYGFARVNVSQSVDKETKTWEPVIGADMAEQAKLGGIFSDLLRARKLPPKVEPVDAEKLQATIKAVLGE